MSCPVAGAGSGESSWAGAAHSFGGEGKGRERSKGREKLSKQQCQKVSLIWVKVKHRCMCEHVHPRTQRIPMSEI